MHAAPPPSARPRWRHGDRAWPPTRSTSAPIHVLVVDDIAANLRLLDAVLTPRGFVVDTAASGRRGAGARSRQHDIDVVLLDVNMPGMTGYEVCRRIRDDERTRLLPVVMVTAAPEEERVLALEAGADDFLRQPLEQAELLARVRSLARLKRYHDAVGPPGRRADRSWNQTLEERVQDQMVELERLRVLRRFLSPQLAEAMFESERPVAARAAPPRGRRARVGAARARRPCPGMAGPEEELAVLESFHEMLGRLIGEHGATVGAFTGESAPRVLRRPGRRPRPDAARRRRSPIGPARRRRRAHAPATPAAATRSRPPSASTSATPPSAGSASRAGSTTAPSGPSSPGPGSCARWPATARCSSGNGPTTRSRGTVSRRRARARRAGTAGPTGRQRPPARRRVPDAHRARSPADPAAAGGPATSGRPSATAPRTSTSACSARSRCASTAGRSPSRRRRSGPSWPCSSPTTAAPSRSGQLAEDLWEGSPPESASAALRVHVSRLRRTLAASGDRGDPRHPAARATCSTCPPRPSTSPASSPLVAAARGRGGRRAAPSEAVTGFRGGPRPLAGARPSPRWPRSTFATAEAIRLEQSRLTTLEDCLAAELACGRHREVTAELEALVHEHALRERLWELRPARRCTARAASPTPSGPSRSSASRLGEELGLDPSPGAAGPRAGHRRPRSRPALGRRRRHRLAGSADPRGAADTPSSTGAASALEHRARGRLRSHRTRRV